MKKFILMMCSAMLLCACSHSKTVADKTDSETAKPAAEKVEVKKAADGAEAEKNTAEQNVPQKAALRVSNDKVVKYEHFNLVVSQNLAVFKTVTPAMAADQIERSLVTNYEGFRTKQPWFIRIAGTVDIDGVRAFNITAGQGDDEGFEPVIHAAVTESKQIFLNERNKWMQFGSIAEDAEEPVEVK